jgi:hypothetical protein
MYQDIDPLLVISALRKSIKGFQNASNFSRAATKWEVLAKLYETIGDLPNANNAYAEAAQMFLIQRLPNLANKSREKNAELTDFQLKLISFTTGVSTLSKYFAGHF